MNADTPVDPEPRRALETPGRNEVAKKRGIQTLLQSLGIDVAVGLALALATLIGPWESWGDVQWSILGFAVAKSIVQAVVSWVIRRYADASGFKDAG